MEKTEQKKKEKQKEWGRGGIDAGEGHTVGKGRWLNPYVPRDNAGHVKISC